MTAGRQGRERHIRQQKETDRERIAGREREREREKERDRESNNNTLLIMLTPKAFVSVSIAAITFPIFGNLVCDRTTMDSLLYFCSFLIIKKHEML